MSQRLNGWQRIGIVLSVCWIAFILLVVARGLMEVKDFDEDLTGPCPNLSIGAFLQWNDAQDGGRLSIRQDEETSVGCSELAERAAVFKEARNRGIIEPVKAVQWPKVLLAMVLPIAASWLIAYVIYWTYRWIRAGFKSAN
jgi:hypothetical protein